MVKRNHWNSGKTNRDELPSDDDLAYLRKHMPPPLEKTVERFVTEKLPGLKKGEKETAVNQLVGAVRGVFCDEVGNNTGGVNSLMSDLVRLHKREVIDLTDDSLSLGPVAVSRITGKPISNYRSDDARTVGSGKFRD